LEKSSHALVPLPFNDVLLIYPSQNTALANSQLLP
jgi:uncharacterized protein (DUF697 family)